MLSTVNTFSEWLIEILNERNLSQSDLARKANVSRASISNVISERREVGPDLASSIAMGLDLPEDTVFRAAGLLKQVRDDDPLVKEAIYLIGQLPEDRKSQVIDYIRFLLQAEEAQNRKTLEQRKGRAGRINPTE